MNNDTFRQSSSPSRTYVALCYKLGTQYGSFEPFIFTLPADQENTVSHASWFFLNRIDNMACIAGCVKFEDIYGMPSHSAYAEDRLVRFIRNNIHTVWAEYSRLPENTNLRIIFPQGGIPIIMQWGVSLGLSKDDTTFDIVRGQFVSIQAMADYFQNI